MYPYKCDRTPSLECGDDTLWTQSSSLCEVQSLGNNWKLFPQHCSERLIQFWNVPIFHRSLQHIRPFFCAPNIFVYVLPYSTLLCVPNIFTNVRSGITEVEAVKKHMSSDAGQQSLLQMNQTLDQVLNHVVRICVEFMFAFKSKRNVLIVLRTRALDGGRNCSEPV